MAAPVLQREAQRFGDIARTLYENGYQPTPCRGKNPNIGGENWNQPLTEQRLAEYITQHPGSNTGIVARGIVGIDVDVTDPEKAVQARGHAAEVFPEGVLIRIGNAPKFLILGADGGDVHWAKPHPVEVFAEGKGQFVAFGRHPDTGRPYVWTGSDPLTTPLMFLPKITGGMVREFLRRLDTDWGTDLLAAYVCEPAERPHGASTGEWRHGVIGLAFEKAGLSKPRGDLGDKLGVECPWSSEHTSTDDAVSTSVVFAPSIDEEPQPGQPPLGRFHCSHAHCDGKRTTADVLGHLEQNAPSALRDALAALDAAWDQQRAKEVIADSDWASVEAAFHALEHRPKPTPTGIKGLDIALGGGVREGDFIGIGGQAGANKTALLLTILVNAARSGARVAYLSAELDRAEIASRIYARLLFESDKEVRHHVGFRDLLDRIDLSSGSDTLRELVADAGYRARSIMADSMVRELPSAATDADVRTLAMKLREDDPERPLVVIVDPLHRLYASETGARNSHVASRMNANDVDRMTQVAFELKKLATEARAAIWFASDATMATHNQLRGDKKAAAPDTIFRSSYAINNAITAGFSLTSHAVATFNSDEVPGEEKWTSTDPNAPTRHVTQSHRAEMLGHRLGVLRAVKIRHGERRRILLSLVPGASAVYDAEDDLP